MFKKAKKGRQPLFKVLGIFTAGPSPRGHDPGNAEFPVGRWPEARGFAKPKPKPELRQAESEWTAFQARPRGFRLASRYPGPPRDSFAAARNAFLESESRTKALPFGSWLRIQAMIKE